MNNSRPPMSEADRDRIEQEMYPIPSMCFIDKANLTFSYEEYLAEYEGVELDIAEYEKQEREPWARKSARKIKESFR